MDNMAYLQQISAPPAPKKTSLFSSLMDGPLFKILVALGVLAIIIIIVGIITSGGSNSPSERSLVEQTQLRSTSLMKTIDTFNKRLKSSSLRSSGQSLHTVLSETDRNLSAILKSDFSSDDSSSSASADLKSSEDAHIAEVNNTLENARLNASLDRTYARQMALEISLLISLESSALSGTSKSNLRSALESSIKNLSALHSAFDNFSDSNI